MSAFAADNTKAAIDLCLTLFDNYGAHGAALRAAAAANAFVLPYLHGEGGGDKASQKVK